MRLTSTAFFDKGTIPTKHTCDSLDVSPPLRWDEVQEGTKSFALTVTEASTERIHWLVCNIPAEARFIPEGGPVPRSAREVPNDFGKQAYAGPCPRAGEHRYYFTLYALDTEHLPAGVKKHNFIQLCREHMIEKAELMGRYSAGGPIGGL